MRWLKSFLSLTISRARHEYPLWVTVVAALMISNVVARPITSSCGPNTEVLRLDRRTAKKLLLSQIKPSYPPLAKINYIGGNVRLLVTVDCEGKVEKIHVVQGHPFLAIAALDAIRRWVYRPFETTAGPAAFQTVVDVDFSLIGANRMAILNLPPSPDKFLARAIRPPQVASSEQIKGANGSVRVRVLVSKKGRAVDFTLISGNPEEFRLAREAVAHWKFRPARWGNLDVPWYVDVSVPVHRRHS